LAIAILALAVAATVFFVRRQHHGQLQADAFAKPAEVFEIVLHPGDERNEANVPLKFVCEIRNPTRYPLDVRVGGWAIGIDSEFIVPVYDSQGTRQIYPHTHAAIVVSRWHDGAWRDVDTTVDHETVETIPPGHPLRLRLNTPLSLLALRPTVASGSFRIGLFPTAPGRLPFPVKPKITPDSPWAEYVVTFPATDREGAKSRVK
jgi:hypothetical protein